MVTQRQLGYINSEKNHLSKCESTTDKTLTHEAKTN